MISSCIEEYFSVPVAMELMRQASAHSGENVKWLPPGLRKQLHLESFFQRWKVKIVSSSVRRHAHQLHIVRSHEHALRKGSFTDSVDGRSRELSMTSYKAAASDGFTTRLPESELTRAEKLHSLQFQLTLKKNMSCWPFILEACS